MRTPYSNSGSTFLGCPNKFEQGAEVIFTGVPHDGGVTNRPGARFGPEDIRRSSMMMAGECDHRTRVDPYTDLRLADTGDVAIEELEHHVRRNLSTCPNHHPITLGGDHSITYPILKALHDHYGKPINIIHFDAHLDTWEGDSADHGSPIYCGINDGLIGSVAQIGIRGPSTKQAYDFAALHQFKIFTAEDIHTCDLATHYNGVYDVISRAWLHCRDHPTYLTFDIDAIDPSQAPGTGTPEVGGLFTWQVLRMIDELFKTHHFIGMDVVEVAPPYDISNITSLAAATVVWRYMCNLKMVNT